MQNKKILITLPILILLFIGMLAISYINSTEKKNNETNAKIEIKDDSASTEEEETEDIKEIIKDQIASEEDSVQDEAEENVIEENQNQVNNISAQNTNINNAQPVTSIVKTIKVKNGALYNTKANKEFQIIGINFDNNTWNPNITAINTGHNDTSYKELAAIGINTIRFGIAYNMTLQDNFYEWLDTNINEAKDAGIKIILDMHASQKGIQLRDKQASYEFWNTNELQEQFINTWTEIAKHYKDNDTVILYDLLNEPLVVVDEGKNVDEIYYNFISKLVESIRKVDNQTIICIEGYNSSILNYNESIDETTYVANVTNPSEIIKKIKDNNIVFDVHSYSPTEYTFQTSDTPIAYSDVYNVTDKGSWGKGSDYYIIQTTTTNEWIPYESELYHLEDSTVNYGNIRYTFDKGTANDSLWIDNIIIEEYDENMNYIKNIYEFSFDKSKYEWNAYGTQKYGIDNQGYDNIGGSLKLTSTGETSTLTLRIDNTGFMGTKDHYYKIKAHIKTSSKLTGRNARFSLVFRKVGFAGGLKEISNYNMKKYYTFSNETKVPMICNEFGTNYNSIKNSNGADYLYEVLEAAYKYKVNISLFSYSGFDFGLMYDNTRDFATVKSNIRQESYDALYKAINQDKTYTHIFKNIDTMKNYNSLNIGEKILVLGKTKAGVGPKLEYKIVSSESNKTIDLNNGLYAELI